MPNALPWSSVQSAACERAHLERLPRRTAELTDPRACRFDVGDPEVAGDLSALAATPAMPIATGWA